MIFDYSFLDLRCKHSITNSTRTVGKYPEVLNFNQLFLELDWFICNIRGEMNSKGAHQFGSIKGFSLIFCLRDSNENEVWLKGTRNQNH